VVLLDEATPDPGEYHPEPEWYFLFYFQLLRLKLFAGEFGQFMGAVALPVIFMILLVTLPFFDKDPERNIFKRPIALISWIFIMAMIAIFTVSSVINREFLD
ncbi:MAG: cytochrome bc complex cytochrome b subunit, partial [Nitrospira sp.]|nr:cytochrome bc complex cytochrome b subunit [Nitrospira sp.]